MGAVKLYNDEAILRGLYNNLFRVFREFMRDTYARDVTVEQFIPFDFKMRHELDEVLRWLSRGAIVRSFDMYLREDPDDYKEERDEFDCELRPFAFMVYRIADEHSWT